MTEVGRSQYDNDRSNIILTGGNGLVLVCLAKKEASISMYRKTYQTSNLPPIQRHSAKGSRSGRSANSKNCEPSKPIKMTTGPAEVSSLNSGDIKMLESELKNLAERVGKAKYDRKMMQFEYNIMKKDYDFVIEERD